MNSSEELATTITKKTLIKLFPYINDKNKINNLKIDQESIHYISIRDVAENITKIIISHLKDIGFDKNDIIITDATAGVGGNTISFCRNFKFVHAIETDKTRFEYLKNNLEVYKLSNYKLYNDSCLNLFNKTNHNIVFIDPPWGGKLYKNHNKLSLEIDNIKIESICNNLMNKKIVEYTPKLIVLKIPKNYNLTYLNDNIKSNKVYLYTLKKMFIIVIQNF